MRSALGMPMSGKRCQKRFTYVFHAPHRPALHHSILFTHSPTNSSLNFSLSFLPLTPRSFTSPDNCRSRDKIQSSRFLLAANQTPFSSKFPVSLLIVYRNNAARSLRGESRLHTLAHWPQAEPPAQPGPQQPQAQDPNPYSRHRSQLSIPQ